MWKFAIKVVLACLGIAAAASAAPSLETELAALQNEWAVINYQTSNGQQEEAFQGLAKKAESLTTRYPDRTEPRVWEAIVLGSYAKVKGGLGALKLVKQAKGLLEEAERIDPFVLDGSIYTTLGSLYYKVPGWPLGFGDDDKARHYLEMALNLNPNGIDPNFFYGDFLIKKGDYAQAIPVLKRALAAPDRPNRALADSGRRQEIRAALAEAEAHLH